jgi:hypothetical protein
MACRANQVLHVVADFVRDHIGLREIAGRIQPRLHRLIEARVDVEIAVGRAVERANRRWRTAAAGVDAIGEHNQRRIAVRARLRPVIRHASLLELRAPDVFRGTEHRT